VRISHHIKLGISFTLGFSVAVCVMGVIGLWYSFSGESHHRRALVVDLQQSLQTRHLMGTGVSNTLAVHSPTKSLFLYLGRDSISGEDFIPIYGAPAILLDTKTGDQKYLVIQESALTPGAMRDLRNSLGIH